MVFPDLTSHRGTEVSFWNKPGFLPGAFPKSQIFIVYPLWIHVKESSEERKEMQCKPELLACCVLGACRQHVARVPEHVGRGVSCHVGGLVWSHPGALPPGDCSSKMLSHQQCSTQSVCCIVVPQRPLHPRKEPRGAYKGALVVEQDPLFPWVLSSSE